MVKRTDFFEKDIAVVPDLALEYCVAVSSPASTIFFWRPFNAFGQFRLQPGFIQAKTLTKVICIERSIFCN
jgi:hypothetical protein